MDLGVIFVGIILSGQLREHLGRISHLYEGVVFQADLFGICLGQTHVLLVHGLHRGGLRATRPLEIVGLVPISPLVTLRRSFFELICVLIDRI